MQFWELLVVGAIWAAVSELLRYVLELIICPHEIEDKLQTLRRELQTLCSKQKDINKALEKAEHQPYSKMTRVVQNWLDNVERKKSDVSGIEKEIGNGGMNRLLGPPRWKRCLERHIREVTELHQQGHFSQDLVVRDEFATGKDLMTRPLVGQVDILERIEAALTRCNLVGVYGVERIGKSEIISHLNNQLSQGTAFKHVYSVPNCGGLSVAELQSQIARVIGFDITGVEDIRKRAYLVCARLQNSVLILDGLDGYFDDYEVGVASAESGCKLVISTRSIQVCRMVGCEEIIGIERLSGPQSEELFMQTLKLQNPLSSQVEEIAKKIVVECEGLPGKLIKLATTLREDRSIYSWRHILSKHRYL